MREKFHILRLNLIYLGVDNFIKIYVTIFVTSKKEGEPEKPRITIWTSSKSWTYNYIDFG